MSRAILPISVALAAAVVASCGSPPPPEPPPEAVEPAEPEYPRDALVVASQADLGMLNTVVYETVWDGSILANLMRQTFEPTFDCRLTYGPGIADSWTWSDDGLTLTLLLDKELTWHDGKPVTAQDIVFTYAMVRDPQVGSPRLRYLENIEADWPKAIDDHTVEFKYTRTYDRVTMQAHAALDPIPEHVFRDADRATFRGHERVIDPLVTGPWKLAKHDRGSRFVLEPNENFTGPEEMQPKLRRIIFTVLPEYTTRLTELMNGTVDLMEAITIADADRIKADHPEIKIKSRGYRNMDYVAYNLSNPLFEELDVRRALTLSIDIEAMMAKLLTGKDGTKYARRAVSTITPEMCNAHADDIQPLPYDPELAKQLFAKHGWVDSDADGILDKDGKRFAFTLATNSGNKRRADAAILIQADLKKIGVQVNLETLETNTFFGNLRERKYEAALGGWSAALFIDPSTMWASDPDGSKNEFNFTGYRNAEVDALIDKGLNIVDPLEAEPVWREMQAKIYADQPYTFLWWRDELVGVHERFENVETDILSLLRNIHNWEVPADKVKYKR